MNKVEKAFLPKAISRAGGVYYKRDDAIEFVKACQREGIRILGIDGFFLTEKATQPSWEDSEDYSKIEEMEEGFRRALKLLSTRDDGMYFEIVCEN